MRVRASWVGLLLLAAALVSGCHKDQVQGLDATPDPDKSVEFGLLSVGQRKTASVTVRNLGQVALTLSDVTFAGPFELVGLPADPIPAGESGQALIAFAPTAAGDIAGTATLLSSSVYNPTAEIALHGTAFQPKLTVLPAELDFGDVAVGTAKTLPFVIHNPSPAPIGPELTADEPANGFAVVPQGTLEVLVPAGQTTIEVTFAPTSAGAVTSTATLQCPNCDDVNVLFTGNGTGAASGTCTLTASTQVVAFGTQAVGTHTTQTFSLTASGTADCTVQAPFYAPGADPALTVGGLVAYTIPKGTSQPFTAHFDPTASTAPHASTSLQIVSNDPNGAQTVVLTGDVQVVAPPPAPGVLEVTPLALSFNATTPSAPAPQAIQLRNTGGTLINWTASSTDTAVTSTPAAASRDAGAVVTVSVAVAAQATTGTRSSILVVDGGTAGKANVALDIKFTAPPPPPPGPAQLVVSPLHLSYAAVAGVTSTPQSLSIANAGGASLSWTSAPSDPVVMIAPKTGTVAAGAGSFAAVTLGPIAFAGTSTYSLVIDAGAAGKATVQVDAIISAPPPPPPPPQYGTSAWPKWHHDNTNTGLSPVDTSASKGTLRWKRSLGVPGQCVKDSQTGKNIRCGTYTNSPVLTEEGDVVQLSGDGTLWRLNRDTGATQWSVMTTPPWLSPHESTPTVVKQNIFLMTGSEQTTKPQFFKIAAKDGSILATVPPGGTCTHGGCDGWNSAPMLDADGSFYVANDDSSTIDVFDQSLTRLRQITLAPQDEVDTTGGALAADGRGYWSANGRLWAMTNSAMLWSFSAPEIDPTKDWPALAYDHNARSGTVVTPDGTVVFAYERRNSSDKIYTRVWGFAAGPKLKQLWTVQLGPVAPVPGLAPGLDIPPDDSAALFYRAGISSPTVGPDGTVYIGFADGLYAIDPSSGGKVKWGVGMASVYSSPAVSKDGTIYVGSSDGYLYAVTPAGSVRWQYKTKGQVNSSPAIGADGTIYAMSDDGSLYAIK
ncbi:MAG: choice-of-anchor D domain-containing protein [Deltaproteobacteria bacterium]|nr:choice-of-anchor D domain-containing protein [Deltaproteobacteria bacterium]